MGVIVGFSLRKVLERGHILTPNYAFERSARQLRCQVPSSLRSSAPAHRERWPNQPLPFVSLRVSSVILRVRALKF